MMFSKFIVLVSGDVDIRNYKELVRHLFVNTDMEHDIIISKGPLDVLDHSSDCFAFGGKIGIDASVKLAGEGQRPEGGKPDHPVISSIFKKINGKDHFRIPLRDIPLVLISVSKDSQTIKDLMPSGTGISGLVLIVLDINLDLDDERMLIWQVLSNTDPHRDISFIEGNIIIDSTSKTHPLDNFNRDWPNVVMSDDATINIVNNIMRDISELDFIESPSLKLKNLNVGNGAYARRVE